MEARRPAFLGSNDAVSGVESARDARVEGQLVLRSEASPGPQSLAFQPGAQFFNQHARYVLVGHAFHALRVGERPLLAHRAAAA